MSTPFTDVYAKFNTVTEDAQLFSRLDDDELLELLEIFLSKSRTVYFKNCLIDLTDINILTKQFNQNVDAQSQWILAEGMKLTWLERNLIDKFNELIKSTKVSMRDLTVLYSFDGFYGFN